MRNVGLLAGLMVVSLGATARAGDGDSFEKVAGSAVRLDRAALAGVLWSLTAKCDSGDDLAKRQCRAVKAALVHQAEGQTFLVDGDASAFSASAFDEKKKSAPIEVQGCIACVDPILIDGAPLYVIGDAAPVEFDGAVAKAGPVHASNRTFQSASAASDWKTKVAPRLRTEFVVQIGGSDAWTKGGKNGVSVKILGFRVFDPCDGGIVCASPKSSKAEIDHAACGDTVAEGGADGGDKPPPPPKDADVPEELSPDMIMAAMKPVRDAADACFDKFGVPGEGKVKVTVARDGTVAAVEEIGDFDGTPTGECIDAAVKAVQFPATQKAKQSFKYPLLLR